jgi:hypothetical protein
LRTSKYEEYRDLRNGFFVRKLDATFDNLFGSHNYIRLQSQKTLYQDQSYLATFGQYGKFKFQFRYDEIPHVYSNTARTLFVQTSPGVWSFPAAIRSTLQASDSTNLPSLIAGTGTNAQQGVVTNFNFITPSITRKAGTISASYDLTSNLNLNGMYWRESQNGYRPIGLIMNSSPSASVTSGFGVELPETISYFNNLVRVGGEYGKRDWGVEAAYSASGRRSEKPHEWALCFVSQQPGSLLGFSRGNEPHQVHAFAGDRKPWLASTGRTVLALHNQRSDYRLWRHTGCFVHYHSVVARSKPGRQ